MDLIDRRILCELDLNCRAPLTQVAKRLRISRNTLAYRIKQLENEGIITKYICSINLGLLGYKTYKIFFKIKNDKKESEFVKYLIDSKKVIHLLKTEGNFDYSMAVAVKNILELDDFLSNLKNDFKDFISDYFVSILVYSKIFKLNKLLLDQKQAIPKFEKYSVEDENIKIDEKDIKIIKELSQNANLSIVELSKKTDLSIDVVKYRLKNISTKIVNSYRIMLDFNKLGYYHYLIMLKIKNITKNEERRLLSWCTNKNNVIYCNKRIGSYDFEVNCAIKDIDDLNKFIIELKNEFYGVIDSYQILLNNKLLKLNYVPF